ncbi:Rep family protein [Lactiplantibacillus plantarum]|uniref:Rep family protein n=1 Tax=Lactiplantibacillus plantarum TaxID=1590 RepID=UPI0018AD5F49|nr:Rep family protein [Lactiplantibacillus plantarum]MBS0939836.1 AAA family ATPase [Lactiplantibacillus plantarum]WGF85466.1 Rep family protein [Lactiplantibacillus plantarum]WGG42791.1 Rep family protein [Lactiplantibacillus plantarum]
MAKSSTLTCVMIAQQLQPEFWHDWDEEPIQQAQDGNAKPLLEKVVKRLNNGTVKVSEAYGIIHNKDEEILWDAQTQQNVTRQKEDHVHFLLKFEKGDTINSLAASVGIEAQYLEKAKSGRYGYDNLLAYMVHAKDKDKFQYKPQEVITVAGEDYLSLYKRRREVWLRGRATKEAETSMQSVDYLVAQVLQGKLTKGQVMSDEDLYMVYGLNSSKINDAFTVVGERKSITAQHDIETKKFKKSIVFISGVSGSGKTMFGKFLIRQIQSLVRQKLGTDWDYCVTASTNPFDEYNGQEILFLDDVRGETLGFLDWLKLLDPYNISPISARYHNKYGAAKVIIITSPKSPERFFGNNKSAAFEDLGQFFRRIDLWVDLSASRLLLKRPIKYVRHPSKKYRFYRRPSHRFSKDGLYTKPNAIQRILKTITKNMRWKSTKKTSPIAGKQK